MVRFMGVGIVFNFAICGYTNCLVSFRQDKVMLRAVTAIFVWVLLTGFTLVPWLGSLGAAIVYAGLDFTGWVSSLPTYRKIVGSLLPKIWIWPVVGGTAIACAAWLLQRLNLPWPLRAAVEAIFYWAIVGRGLLRTRVSTTVAPVPSARGGEAG